MNYQRGIQAVVIGTILFVLCMWSTSPMYPIWLYFENWPNTAITVVWYSVFAALVFWLFSRSRKKGA